MAYDTAWNKYDPWRSLVEANNRVLRNLPKDIDWTGNFAYRFREQRYASSDPWGDGDTYSIYTQIELQSFAIKKVTPCGIRIWVQADSGWTTRFVNLEVNKKFALPTIPEAIDSYVARKERQARIYEAKASTARKMMAQIWHSGLKTSI